MLPVRQLLFVISHCTLEQHMTLNIAIVVLYLVAMLAFGWWGEVPHQK